MTMPTHNDETLQERYQREQREMEQRMNTEEIQVNEIVQVDPKVDTFGACMVVVTEVKSWGIQGYVQSAGVPGQQYVRLKTADFARTGGMAEWVVQ